MNRKVSIVALLVVILLGASLFPFFSAIGAEEGMDGTPRPMADDYYGDYYVYAGNVDYIQDQEWNMYGNIYVYGTLYITNTKIYWGGSEDGEYGLYVASGGALYIDDNCNFTAMDTTTHQYREKDISPNRYIMESWGIHWKFQIRGTARINNSYFGYLWGETGGYITDHEGGILCANDDIIIYNCVIQYSECTGIGIFDPDYPDYQSQGLGFSPRIDRVKIDNTTRYGIFIGGDQSAPTITNSTITGAPVIGITYFVGADGVLEDTMVSLCEYGLELDPVTSIGYSGNLVVNRCHFDANNNTGYLPGRGGTVNFWNCSFDDNLKSGVAFQYTTANGIQTVNVYNSQVKNNGEDGVTSFDPTVSSVFQNVEISGNGRHGIWLPSGMASSPYIRNVEVHDNGGYGIYSNGSYGTVDGCMIFGNGLGNVYAVNGSMIAVSNSEIYDSRYGVRVVDSLPTLEGNQIFDCVTGLDARGTSEPALSGNSFRNNNQGLYLAVGSFPLSIEGGSFEGNREGIVVRAGGPTDFTNIDVRDSSVAGISCLNGANITVRTSPFTNNVLDFSMDGGSLAKAYSCGVPKEKVKMVDYTSEFWHHWGVSIYAYDNQTLFPISSANLIVYGVNGEILIRERTSFIGMASGDVMEYHIRGIQTSVFTPVNITVTKAGYVPYLGGYGPLINDVHLDVNMSVNKAPEFPDPWYYSPDETHRNRPTLTWNGSYDWNSDIIRYKVNVFQDELYSANHVVIDAIAREPMFIFTKNLKYNKEFFVEIETYDPWGGNDTKVFSFRTINTKPSTPVVAYEFSPVSTRDDITLLIVVNSTDIDTDPVDEVSYLVEWEVERSGSWVLIASGINAFVLPSNKTNEGDRIRTRVKPFDGIEYGQEVTVEIRVVNFAPELVSKYVDLEINEDEIALNRITLDDYFTDQDLDELTYSVFFQRHISAEIEPVSNNLTLVPIANWVGSDYLLIEALDGKHGNEDLPKLRINITVNGINDPPVISLLNEKVVRPGVPTTVQFIQGSWAVLSVSASDADEIYGDDFTFSTDLLDVVGTGTIRPEDLQFQTSTGGLRVFLTNQLVGQHYFNITATDSEGASYSAMVHLIVENINEAPTAPQFVSPSGDTVDQQKGGRVSFEVSEADDPDLHIPDSKEKIFYDWCFGELDIDQNEIWVLDQGTNVSHQFLNSGLYTIKVRARDSLELTAVTEKDITINVIKDDVIFVPAEDDKSFLEEFGLILLLIIVGLVIIAGIVFLVMRKEPLAEVAQKQEKEHEELVAKQQQDALAAQEKLQALLGSVAMAGAAGPALPSPAAGAELQALPAASVPEAQMPPPEQPAADTVAFQAPPVAEVPLEHGPEPPSPVVGQVPQAAETPPSDQTYLPPPTQ